MENNNKIEIIITKRTRKKGNCNKLLRVRSHLTHIPPPKNSRVSPRSCNNVFVRCCCFVRIILSELHLTGQGHRLLTLTTTAAMKKLFLFLKPIFKWSYRLSQSPRTGAIKRKGRTLVVLTFTFVHEGLPASQPAGRPRSIAPILHYRQRYAV